MNIHTISVISQLIRDLLYLRELYMDLHLLIRLDDNIIIDSKIKPPR